MKILVISLAILALIIITGTVMIRGMARGQRPRCLSPGFYKTSGLTWTPFPALPTAALPF